MTAPANVRLATAGWAVPRAIAAEFHAEGSGLQRYAARLPAVEINSTFYRPHRAITFARWRDTTPEGFRFAVKLPKALTHVARLADDGVRIAAFLDQIAPLGDKRGPLLAQLPPSLAFDPPVAGAFFQALRERWSGDLVCEPRHVSWFEPAADTLLAGLQVARAAADPMRHPAAGTPGGWQGLAYWRLHGSPRIYYSPYDAPALQALAAAIAAHPAPQAWCVFDNTTSGAAAANALSLQAILGAAGSA